MTIAGSYLDRCQMLMMLMTDDDNIFLLMKKCEIVSTCHGTLDHEPDHEQLS